MKPRRVGLPAQRMCDLVLEVGRFGSGEPNRCGIVDRCRLAPYEKALALACTCQNQDLALIGWKYPVSLAGRKKLSFWKDCDWMRTGTYFGVIPRSTDLV